jgi:hypothetical protein
MILELETAASSLGLRSQGHSTAEAPNPDRAPVLAHDMKTPSRYILEVETSIMQTANCCRQAHICATGGERCLENVVT